MSDSPKIHVHFFGTDGRCDVCGLELPRIGEKYVDTQPPGGGRSSTFGWTQRTLEITAVDVSDKLGRHVVGRIHGSPMEYATSLEIFYSIWRKA